MKEIWKDIPEYEGLYQVSNLGNIRRLNYRNSGKEKILKKDLNKNGYFMIHLKKKQYKHIYIHRLLAQVFIENPENKPQINHKNGIRNDNRLENLEWCTVSENHLHKYKILGFKMGINSINNRILKVSKKINQYDLEGNFIRSWSSMKDIQNTLYIDRGSISRTCNGKSKTAGGFIWKISN